MSSKRARRKPRKQRGAPQKNRPNSPNPASWSVLRADDLVLRIPWKPGAGAVPALGEVVRLIQRPVPDRTRSSGVSPGMTLCVGLLEDGKIGRLPHGALGVELRCRMLPDDTGHATWELEFEAGEVVSGGMLTLR